MKRFKFKLEAVLTERKRVEDVRLREWTLTKRFLQALLEDLSDLEKGLEDGIARVTELNKLSEESHIGMYAALEAFISGQKTRIIWKSQEIQKATKLSERARVEYIKMRQKREALEKLKERKNQDYRKEVRKSEFRQIDDIYIMNGAARRKLESEDKEDIS